MPVHPNSLANLKNRVKIQYQRKCAKPGCGAVARGESRFCKHHGGRNGKGTQAPEKLRRKAVYASRRALIAELDALPLKGTIIPVTIYDDPLLDRAAALATAEYEKGELSWKEYQSRLIYLDSLQRPHIRNKVSHAPKEAE